MAGCRQAPTLARIPQAVGVTKPSWIAKCTRKPYVTQAPPVPDRKCVYLYYEAPRRKSLPWLFGRPGAFPEPKDETKNLAVPRCRSPFQVDIFFPFPFIDAAHGL